MSGLGAGHKRWSVLTGSPPSAASTEGPEQGNRSSLEDPLKIMLLAYFQMDLFFIFLEDIFLPCF